MAWFIIAVAVVVGLPALLMGLLKHIPPELARGEWPQHWRLPIKAGHLMAALVLLGLGFAILQAGPRDAEFVLVLAALVVLALFFRAWRDEFVFLMSLRDDELPGRFDKLIWVGMLFALAPVGIWFFRSYRLTHWPESEPAAVHAKPGRVSDVLG